MSRPRNAPKPDKRLRALAKETAKVFCCNEADVLGSGRRYDDAKHAFRYVAKVRVCLSYSEMGRQLRNDHTSISASVKRTKLRIQRNSPEDLFFIHAISKLLFVEVDGVPLTDV